MRWFCKFQFVFLIAVGVAIGGETLPGSKEVEIGGQPHKRLLVAPLAELHSTVLYGAGGVVSEDSTGVCLLFGGTAGNNQKYGIAGSMAQTANFLLKKKVDPIGFENPIYYQAAADESVRRPYLDKYGTLDGQMTWFFSVIEFALKKMEREGGSKKLYLFGRSTGAALIAEALSRYVAGDAEAQVLARVDKVLMNGLFGHNDEDIRLWRGIEIVIKEDDPAIEDALVAPYGPRLFSSMRWGGTNGRPVVNDRLASFPEVLSIVAAQDEFYPRESQLAALKQLSANHPQLSVTGLLTDMLHNATWQLDYEDLNGQHVKAPTMARFKPILERLIGEDTEPSAPGLTLETDPRYTAAPSRICANQMARAAHAAVELD